MTVPITTTPHRHDSPWPVVARTALALAAAMGVGRFAYTAILPLMVDQTGMSSQLGASLATANYIGYLVGALAGTVLPGMMRSVAVYRGSLVVLILTVAAMPLTENGLVWWLLRLVTGVTSALVFVIAMTALLSHLHGHPNHYTGWAFGGVGAGIAVSGCLVLILRSVADWHAAWWASAALAFVCTVGAWSLAPEPAPAPTEPTGSIRAVRPWFVALFTSYTLDGIGYIIGGTFLVAAIDQTAPGWLGEGAWVLVGLAAVPSCALWAWLAHRWSRPTLLIAALLIQGLGMLLPALGGGTTITLIAAILYGGTFIGIVTLTMGIGTHLRVPRAVALLTAGYGVGQILGPVVVTPVLGHGYHQALLVGCVIVLGSAAAAGVLRVRFPRHVGSNERETGHEFSAV